jgi:transcriptional regulator with XRE-family HTH domain
MAVPTEKWVLRGAEVRELRLRLGLTQRALGDILGFRGSHIQNQIDQIEREKNGRHLGYAQAHLLIAIVRGYVPYTETN